MCPERSSLSIVFLLRNWLPLKMLHLLGESTEFDEHCLSPGAVLRKSKSSTKSTKTVSSQVAQLVRLDVRLSRPIVCPAQSYESHAARCVHSGMC